METIDGTGTHVCTNECEGCIFNNLKKSISEKGPDSRVNHGLHKIRSIFKSSMLKNTNGFPMSRSDKTERIERTETAASQCRHSDVQQIVFHDLNMVRAVMGNVRLGSAG